MTFYFVACWYTVYVTKKNLHNWEEDVNPVRVWLFIESAYLFKWIFSSMVFVTSAHVFKFQSSLMTEEEIKMDDDVWNDRNSCDFLRYMKHDFFMFVYLCTHFINNILYGFNDYPLLNAMGEREKSTTVTCLAILAWIRFNQLMHVVYEMRNNGP